MTNEKNILAVQAEHQGLRLDRFLSLARPGLGLRAAKRLLARGGVLVDGLARSGLYKLRTGQTVEITTQDDGPEFPLPWLVQAGTDFVAFFKPPGLHTVRLAGSGGPSLEDHLARLVPDRRVWLVNRLDNLTSGLVLGAFSQEAEGRFRDMENHGRVEKRYLAVVPGLVDKPARLAWKLDTAGGSRVKVLLQEDADPLRWTWVRPLAGLGAATLVEARIAKGARHQIRAHLAAFGHPIAGDPLYGYGPACGAVLYLHHYLARLPGLTAKAAPDWPELKAELEIIMNENQGGDACDSC